MYVFRRGQALLVLGLAIFFEKTSFHTIIFLSIFSVKQDSNLDIPNYDSDCGRR